MSTTLLHQNEVAPVVLLEPLLEDLASRLDSAIEDGLLAKWNDFWMRPCPDGLFATRRPAPAPARIDWPEIHTNDTLGEDDIDRMVASQLKGCSDLLGALSNPGFWWGSGALLCVRSNYGVGTLPTVFGATPFVMPRAQNCSPNARHIGSDAIRRCLDRGVPDLRTGYGDLVLRAGQRFREAFAPYPALVKYVHIYHPDLQGPMDVCELLWGSDLFVDLYDEPELVHDCLRLICETYEAFMREWWKIAPPEEGLSYHWGMAHRGKVLLRDDSAMNLSPEMFDEFILPYDERLLKNLGGGGIHSCGRVDHYMDRLERIAGLTFFNLSQPEYNDMEKVYTGTVDKGIRLLGLNRAEAERALAAGRNLRGLVHC